MDPDELTHLLCGMFIRIIQVMLLLLLLVMVVPLLLECLTDEAGHLALCPRLFPTNQKPVCNKVVIS